MANEMNEMVVADNGKNTMQTTQLGSLNVFSDLKSFETALRMADCLAKSTIVPKDYQNNTGNCMIAIEMAIRINTSPMMVMQNLYVVNGRPAWSSQWIIAMINTSRKYKTELKFDFGDAKEDGGLSCQAWAEDYSGNKVVGPKITMTMANAEGWTTKNGSKWKTMPNVMIQYRAASFFGRMKCPEMIMGIYSQEEAAEMVDLNETDYGLVIDAETGAVNEIEIPHDELITQEQRQGLFKFVNEELGEGGNDILKEAMTEFNLESTAKMPVSMLEKVKNRAMEIAKQAKAENGTGSKG